MIIALAPLLISLCAAWVGGFAYLMRTIRRLAFFHEQHAPLPDVWPRLSVVIPACNEATTLEAAVQTLLTQDYPDLEIILVNDRSSDGTGALIDLLARRDSRIRGFHVETLPEGWLGKVHALQRGVEQSSGDWLLFTDADVHFAAATLSRAIALVLYRNIDHLTLIPRSIQKSFWLEVAVRTFGLLFLIATRAGTVNQPRSKAYVGIGAFNLVDAKRFRATAGFEWLRLEPGDDVGLAMMMKQSGATACLAVASENLTVQWYSSLPAMFKGLEKNLFGPGSNYRWTWLFLQVGGIWTLALAPYAAFSLGLEHGSLILAVAGAAAITTHLIFSLGFVSRRPFEILGVMLFPAGLLLISAMMLRAGYQCLKNGGIEWRGTHYSMEQLRAGQRVGFRIGKRTYPSKSRAT